MRWLAVTVAPASGTRREAETAIDGLRRLPGLVDGDLHRAGAVRAAELDVLQLQDGVPDRRDVLRTLFAPDELAAFPASY